MSDAISEMIKKQARVQEGGVYCHFKGGIYVVLAVLNSSESPTGEKMVAYMNTQTGKRYWRPYAGEDGFTTDKKLEDGKEIVRFLLIGFATITIDKKGSYHVTREY